MRSHSRFFCAPSVSMARAAETAQRHEPSYVAWTGGPYGFFQDLFGEGKRRVSCGFGPTDPAWPGRSRSRSRLGARPMSRTTSGPDGHSSQPLLPLRTALILLLAVLAGLGAGAL